MVSHSFKRFSEQINLPETKKNQESVRAHFSIHSLFSFSAAGELEGGSARMSPVGSASGSQNLNLTLEQPDPVSRATQQYLEVLKKNYMI